MRLMNFLVWLVAGMVLSETLTLSCMFSAWALLELRRPFNVKG